MRAVTDHVPDGRFPVLAGSGPSVDLGLALPRNGLKVASGWRIAIASNSSGGV